MAWIYFLESGESATHYANSCDQLPTAKSTIMQEQFFCPEWPVNKFTLLRFGMTSVLLKETHSKELLTSSMGDFRARISVYAEMEKAWEASKAVFIGKSIGWQGKFFPNGYSWKTCHPLPTEEALRSLNRLPKSGMVADGVFYRLRDAERLKNGKDSICSQWRILHAAGNISALEMQKLISKWPTPLKHDSTGSGIHSELKRDSPGLWFRVYQISGKKLNPPFVEWMMGYPIGWTELAPWAIQCVLKQRKKRSNI